MLPAELRFMHLPCIYFNCKAEDQRNADNNNIISVGLSIFKTTLKADATYPVIFL